jgi:hypothetical protein
MNLAVYEMIKDTIGERKGTIKSDDDCTITFTYADGRIEFESDQAGSFVKWIDFYMPDGRTTHRPLNEGPASIYFDYPEHVCRVSYVIDGKTIFETRDRRVN